MKKVSTIYVKGDLDETMVRSFKHNLRNNISETIIVRLNSYGGNLHAMHLMSGFLYYLMKYKKRKIIIEIEHAESAALIFAINCPCRRITKKSTSSIHLPVLRKGKIVSEAIVLEKKRRAINFFTSRTKLKEEDIILLENKIISANDMIEFGIANELVEAFSP